MAGGKGGPLQEVFVAIGKALGSGQLAPEQSQMLMQIQQALMQAGQPSAQGAQPGGTPGAGPGGPPSPPPGQAGGPPVGVSPGRQMSPEQIQGARQPEPQMAEAG